MGSPEGLWWPKWKKERKRKEEEKDKKREEEKKKGEGKWRGKIKEKERARIREKWVSGFETRIYSVFDFSKKVAFFIVLRRNFNFKKNCLKNRVPKPKIY